MHAGSHIPYILAVYVQRKVVIAVGHGYLMPAVGIAAEKVGQFAIGVSFANACNNAFALPGRAAAEPPVFIQVTTQVNDGSTVGLI